MSTIEPLDPNSPEGRRVEAFMSQWASDVLDRLEREGKPIPACFLVQPEAAVDQQS